jgi:hypothetical protein
MARVRVDERQDEKNGAKSDGQNESKDHLLAHCSLMHVGDWIECDTGGENDNSIGQSEQHEFSPRSGSVDQRREKNGNVDDQGGPKTDPRPLLSGIVCAEFVDEELAEAHARNP